MVAIVFISFVLNWNAVFVSKTDTWHDSLRLVGMCLEAKGSIGRRQRLRGPFYLKALSISDASTRLLNKGHL